MDTQRITIKKSTLERLNRVNPVPEVAINILLRDSEELVRTRRMLDDLLTK